jgi:hypothetical protein
LHFRLPIHKIRFDAKKDHGKLPQMYLAVLPEELIHKQILIEDREKNFFSSFSE